MNHEQIIATMQKEMVDYLKPDGINKDEFISRILGWLDGPAQREADAAKQIEHPYSFRFAMGDKVKRKRGNWHGVVVGFYSTELTPEGYCVMSLREYGCVHVEPERMLEAWDGESE